MTFASQMQKHAQMAPYRPALCQTFALRHVTYEFGQPIGSGGDASPKWGMPCFCQCVRVVFWAQIRKLTHAIRRARTKNVSGTNVTSCLCLLLRWQGTASVSCVFAKDLISLPRAGHSQKPSRAVDRSRTCCEFPHEAQRLSHNRSIARPPGKACRTLRSSTHSSRVLLSFQSNWMRLSHERLR